MKFQVREKRELLSYHNKVIYVYYLTTDTLSKLDIFDDSNSFFSSSPSFQQSLLLNKKLEGDVRQPQMNNVTSSHLPDLLNGINCFINILKVYLKYIYFFVGIDGYQKAVNTNGMYGIIVKDILSYIFILFLL